VLSLGGVEVGPGLLFGLEREIIMSQIVVVESLSESDAKYLAIFDSLLLMSTDALGSKRRKSLLSKIIRSSELIMPPEVNKVTCVDVRPASVTRFWSIERLVCSDMRYSSVS
jgi:hypothetical protein